MKKLKILLIDDDPDFLEVNKIIMRDWGHDIVTASGGGAGVESFRANRPDVVVSDYIMHDMDGIDALRAIREIDKGAALIFFTGHPTGTTLESAKELNIAAVIPKGGDQFSSMSMLRSAIDRIAKQNE